LVNRTTIHGGYSQAMLSLLKQKHLSPRQWRSVTYYLLKFDIRFQFIQGKKNLIADLLSRIAERSTYQHDLPYLEESDEHIAAMQLRSRKLPDELNNSSEIQNSAPKSRKLVPIVLIPTRNVARIAPDTSDDDLP